MPQILDSVPNPLYSSFSSLESRDFQRAAEIAYPFLNLYKPIASILPYASCALQSVAILKTTYDDRSKLSINQVSVNMFRVAILVIPVAVMKLFPVVTLYTTYSYSLGKNGIDLAKHLYNQEFLSALENTFQMIQLSVQLGAATYAGPYLLAASYLLQAIEYLKRGYQEAKQEHHLEMVANGVLATISLYQARPHLEEIYEELTSHSMNESEFEELKDLIGADGRERQVIDGIKSIPKSFDLKHKIVESNSQGKIPLAKQVDPLTSAQALEKLELPLQKKIKPKMSFLDGDCWAIRSSYADRWISRYSRSDQKFNLLEFLKERHISRVIKGIDFTDLYWLSNLECKGITFEECRFEYMTMDHSIFERTVFKNCDLQKIKMTYSLFDRCHFIDSNLKNGLFLKSKFIQSVFDQCVLDRVCFESAVFDYCSFYQTAMRGMSLFLAKFSECRAKECDLTQTVLCDAKEGLLLEECTISPKKRPVMAMGCDFRYRMSFGELIENSLKDNEADVLLHSYEPHDVVSYELNREIRETLKEFTPQCQMSRAQFVLASAKPGSQVDKIIQIAKQVLAHSDGVIIPGGSDVEREFYVDEEVSFYTDHRRSMMEFALIAEAEKTNQLVAGICRGSQLLNVYFGGTLRDLDDTSYGIQQLTAVSDEGSRKANRLFSDLFKDGFCGFSCHNQAIDELAPNLQAVLKYEDIIKATESKCGRFFGIQFHPEEYYDLEHQSDLSFVFIRMLRLREFYQKVKSQILRATEEIQGELFEQLEYMIEVGKFSEKANREIYARLVRRAAQLSGKIA